MLKKILLMLCLGAFVVAVGCGEKKEEPKDGADDGDKKGEETPDPGE